MEPIPDTMVMPCNECQAGVMHKRHITYFTWLGEELITVPNFPAWVCDVCGKREYDRQAEIWLQALLKPEAGRPSAKPKKSRQKPTRKNPPVITDLKS
jgi:YgiT-type zinc finger domain-containing protein